MTAKTLTVRAMLHAQLAVLAVRVVEEQLDLAKGSAADRQTDATATTCVSSTVTVVQMSAKSADCTVVRKVVLAVKAAEAAGHALKDLHSKAAVRETP